MNPILAKLASWFAPKRRYRVAIAAIIKNEGPYLLEWIAFHRAVGVEHFFIADNVSDDGTSELLIALAKCGLIERLPYKKSSPRGPQLPAYGTIMRRYRRHADWIAFIDCDEFLTPMGDAVSIHDLLTLAHDDPAAGAICINWAMFGSSGAKPSNDPVIARFSMRAAQEKRDNRVFKTLVRSKAYRRPGLNPHYFELKKNFRALHTDGRELQPNLFVTGVSAASVWDHARLNHYFVKTKPEFDLIKLPRGTADGHIKRRNENEFALADYNDVSDPMPEWLVTATKNEVEKLRDMLRKTGCPEEFVVMDKKLVERIETKQK